MKSHFRSGRCVKQPRAGVFRSQCVFRKRLLPPPQLLHTEESSPHVVFPGKPKELRSSAILSIEHELPEPGGCDGRVGHTTGAVWFLSWAGLPGRVEPKPARCSLSVSFGGERPSRRKGPVDRSMRYCRTSDRTGMVFSPGCRSSIRNTMSRRFGCPANPNAHGTEEPFY